MFSKFFINRPIFATVISLIIVLAGLVSMKVLPVEQYPNILPTEILATSRLTSIRAVPPSVSMKRGVGAWAANVVLPMPSGP